MFANYYPVGQHKNVKGLKLVPWKPRVQPNLKTYTLIDLPKSSFKPVRDTNKAK